MTLDRHKLLRAAILMLIIAGVAAALLWINNQNNNNQEPRQIIFEELEMADEPEERRQGLMNRTELCDRCGMLFVFEESAKRSFWMKDTLIPLDIIYIDSSGVVTNIHRDTEPEQTLETYASTGDAQYVIEVPANQSDILDIVVGDKLDMQLLVESAIDYKKE